MKRWLTRKRLFRATGLFISIFLLTLQARSQVQFRTPGSDSIKVVEILNSDSYRSEKKSDTVELTYLVGHVRIRQEKTLIYCDSMVMNPHDNYVECFGHAHINDNDSTDIYSDYLKYQVDQKMVHFLKNVKLTDGKGELTTEELNYDLAAKVGTYDHGGKVVTKESVLTSDQATYFEVTKDVHFKQNVRLVDPQYDLTADSLLYNTQTQISTFITETFIKFKDTTHRTVRTREGYYDLKNKKAQFGKRPIITDGSQQITGDRVDFDDSTGISTADGNAIYSDTAQGVRLYGGHLVTNKKKNTLLATLQPLMVLKQDKDSLYLTGDTLASGRLVDFEIDQRQIAHEDSLHRIYVDSLEKVQADSLRRLAITRRSTDSLQVIKDSIENIKDKDLSDSLRPGEADSLGRLGLDSLRRLRGDSTLGKEGLLKDSAAAKKLKAAADSAAAHPLTRKEQKRLERAAKDKENARIKAIKDSISDAKYDLKMRQRALQDSIRNAREDSLDLVRVKLDSIRRATTIANFRARKKAEDSLRRIAFADSLRRSGLSDSAVSAILDSTNRRRQADSIAQQAALARHVHITDSLKPDALPPTDSSAIVVPTKDTSLRYIVAYHHVRIFSDSLQAVSDSLYYSTKDSLFRLFYNPVAWGSGNYQVSGDTMYVYTKNKKASRLYVFENALTINKITSRFFNQLKGTTINCYFKEGEMDFIRAKGNSESIYYLKDEHNAYSGVNKAHADIIDMLFSPKVDSAGKPQLDSAGKSKGRELNRVVLRNDAEGSMIPIRRANIDEMVLRGFKWQEDRRPKSKEELFQAIKRPRKYEDEEEPAAEQKFPTPRGPMPKVVVTPQTVKQATPVTPPPTAPTSSKSKKKS